MMSGSAQENFLRSGGVMQAILDQKYASGELNPEYVFQEFPKWIPNPKARRERVKRTTERIQGNSTVLVEWEEEVDIEPYVLVHSEEEAERVRTGGMSDVEIEGQRQSLVQEAKARGLRVDPSWGIARLEDILGKPTGIVEDLEAKVAAQERENELLRQLAELQRANAEMQAQLADRKGDERPGNERAELTEQLQSLGIEVDGRWSLPTLRVRLEEATRPRR